MKETSLTFKIIKEECFNVSVDYDDSFAGIILDSWNEIGRELYNELNRANVRDLIKLVDAELDRD